MPQLRIQSSRADESPLPMSVESDSSSFLHDSEGFPLSSFNSFGTRSMRVLRPKRVTMFLKISIIAAILSCLLAFSLWEPHIELAFYSRAWVQAEIIPVEPLYGCFDSSRVSNKYNLTEAFYGKKRTEVQAGMSLRMGLDCYDFAGTLQPDPLQDLLPGQERVNFHTYWRVDLAPFSKRQEWMLKSFFATQNLNRTKLILWSNGDLSGNPVLAKWLDRFPDAFELKEAQIQRLALGTKLEESKLLRINDEKAWVDGDLIRLLVIWNYGGVWVDMDSLLTRDLSPLLEHEFVTQWDCYDKIYQPLNGALMHFRQHSPYLCEAFHIMQSSSSPREGSTDWGSLLYLKLWRRLVAAHVPPFKILPFCFSDGRSCRLDNRLPDPFKPDSSNGKWTMGLGVESGGGLDRVLQNVFSVHLHNQWEKAYPINGWVERLLLRRYDTKLAANPTA